MTLILPIEHIGKNDRSKVGGKAFALASLLKAGFNVPMALCVTSDAYDRYVSSTGIRERILMEIHRKAFEDMRWEEMWDASLRIRNMFLTTPMPKALKDALGDNIAKSFGEQPSAVRSSSPGEDSKKASFAGLHDSYVNVRTRDAILENVIKVWASLWSDAALLYRKELGLDPKQSTMAVVIQEMVFGDRAGVAFCRSPVDPLQAVIESVYGLIRAWWTARWSLTVGCWKGLLGKSFLTRSPKGTFGLSPQKKVPSWKVSLHPWRHKPP